MIIKYLYVWVYSHCSIMSPFGNFIEWPIFPLFQNVFKFIFLQLYLYGFHWFQNSSNCFQTWWRRLWGMMGHMRTYIIHIINWYTQPWSEIFKGRSFGTRLVNLGAGNPHGSWNKSLPSTVQPSLMVGIIILSIIRH